jgi:hypothetical protein
MLQAIVTKYHGPTNHKGSRVSAKADAGRIVIAWDYALNPDENHAAAARALADRLGWGEAIGYPVLAGGALPGNAGYCFVMAKGGAA